MQVSVESTSSIERQMTVQVPAERVDEAVDARLKSLRGRVRINGFRPGKVPLKIVKQQYGASVYQEVLSEVLQSSFQEAVEQEKLQPAGGPSIEPINVKQGEPLEYKATFEVYPEIEVADVSSLEITRYDAEIAESDIDKMIENLRKQRQTWEAVERASQSGDEIVIDFKGYIGDEAFDGGEAEDLPVVIGEGRMISDFEDQLVGLSAGDEKEIQVTFPEDYHVKDLAGKEARFEVKVKEVREPRLPAVDDAFLEAFGITEGGVEKLREDIRENMQRELKAKLKSKVKAQVMDGLLALHQIDVPKALVAEEIGRMRQQAMASAQGANESMFPDELFEEEARKRVALGLIVGEIIRAREIELDKDRVEAELDELAASYEDADEVKKYYRSNPGQMAMLEAMVLEDQVVDWVLNNAKVSDEKTSFADIMEPGK